MKQLTPQQQRALRRRHKHERQAVLFGTLIAGLSLAGLGAAAVYTGAMDGEFLDREFTTKTPDIGLAGRPAPCPPEGAVSVAYASIQIHVLNSTSRAGLAGSTAELLASRGFVQMDTGNFQAPFDGTARIQFGVAGLAGAYTLASTIPDAALMLDTREDASVDLVLGTKWEAMIPREEVTLTLGDPLVGVAGCVPLEEALVGAPAGPTAEPTEAPTGEPTAPATPAPPAEG